MSELLKSAPTAEATDPRILRSRRMLMEALVNLLNKKEFEDISIQEIVDEATLNRATFYLHYADKNALLQAMTATRFRDLRAHAGGRGIDSARGAAEVSEHALLHHPAVIALLGHGLERGAGFADHFGDFIDFTGADEGGGEPGPRTFWNCSR